MPGGMGLHLPRCREAVFLLQAGVSDEDKIRMAVSLYALYMLVNHFRWQGTKNNFNYNAVLWIWSRRAAEGSRAWQLLKGRALGQS